MPSVRDACEGAWGASAARWCEADEARVRAAIVKRSPPARGPAVGSDALRSSRLAARAGEDVVELLTMPAWRAHQYGEVWP